MRVRVLGCGGGIGGRSPRTMSLLVDGNILVDAGTGLSGIPLDELAAIDHVFITHPHLDHIAELPLMIDSVADLRHSPVMVYATTATIRAIRAHIFNWTIWPDFSKIASTRCQVMHYNPIHVGQHIQPGGKAVITALPVEHTTSSVGYRLDSGEASLVYTGDTTANDPLWQEVNQIANLRYLIIETAFSNRDETLAINSKHLCPRLLFSELEKLTTPAEIFVSHLKPGQVDLITHELDLGVTNGRFRPKILGDGQIFEF